MLRLCDTLAQLSGASQAVCLDLDDGFNCVSCCRGSYAVVRFAPQATADDMTNFLRAYKATVVEGPLKGQLYRTASPRQSCRRKRSARSLGKCNRNRRSSASSPPRSKAKRVTGCDMAATSTIDDATCAPRAPHRRCNAGAFRTPVTLADARRCRPIQRIQFLLPEPGRTALALVGGAAVFDSASQTPPLLMLSVIASVARLDTRLGRSPSRGPRLSRMHRP